MERSVWTKQDPSEALRVLCVQLLAAGEEHYDNRIKHPPQSQLAGLANCEARKQSTVW